MVEEYIYDLFESVATEGPEKLNLFVRNFVNCLRAHNLNFNTEFWHSYYFSYDSIGLLVEDEELISLLESTQVHIHSQDIRTFDLVHLKRLESIYSSDSIFNLNYEFSSSGQLSNLEGIFGVNLCEVIGRSYKDYRIELFYSRSILFYLQICIIFKYLIDPI